MVMLVAPFDVIRRDRGAVMEREVVAQPEDRTPGGLGKVEPVGQGEMVKLSFRGSS
jgi:hypothetical protein